MTGVVEANHFDYFRGARPGQAGGRGRALVRLGATSRRTKHFRLTAAGDVRGDDADRVRTRAYVNEAYADVFLKRLDLRLGKQIIAWGTTDFINPTDNLTPTDFTEPLDTRDERMGGVAGRARLALGRAQFDAVVIPTFTPSRLPRVGSRWYAPLASTMPSPLDPTRTIAAAYEPRAPRRPASTPGNMQYALRTSSTLGRWDLSASYFDGWDDLPASRPEVTMVDTGQVRVALAGVHGRRRAAGGDVATTLGPYNVRAEAAYIMPGAAAGPDYFQYVLGAERLLGDPMAPGGTLLLMQWTQALMTRAFTPSPFDLNHVARKAAMARVQRTVTRDLQLTADALYTLYAHGFYVRPAASFRLREQLRLEVAADVLGGDERTFFGATRRNTRVQSTLRYTF